MKRKPVAFELFKEGEERFITFEDIVPNLYTPEYLKEIKGKIG